MKEAWGGSSVTTMTAGPRVTKRMHITLSSGEYIATSYPQQIVIGILGTINQITLTRENTGYVQPITLEGLMLQSGYEWGPVQMWVFSGDSSY
jgi:hypothetical protein